MYLGGALFLEKAFVVGLPAQSFAKVPVSEAGAPRNSHLLKLYRDFTPSLQAFLILTFRRDRTNRWPFRLRNKGDLIYEKGKEFMSWV